MNKDIPLSYVLIPILAFWLVIGASIQDWPQNGQEANRVPNFAYSERSLSIVQGNSLKGVSVPAEFKPETFSKPEEPKEDFSAEKKDEEKFSA